MRAQVHIHEPPKRLPAYNLGEAAKELNRPLSVKERAQHAEDVLEIKKALTHLVDDTAVRLMRIQETRSYRETHATFEQFCLETFDFGARRGRQLAVAGWVFQNLLGPPAAAAVSDGPNPKAVLPTSERQTRPLGKLSETEQREVWKEAVEASGGEVPTAKTVEAVVEKRKWPKPNEHGVWDNQDAELHELRLSNLYAGLRVLQIGEKQWISCIETRTCNGGGGSPLRLHPNFQTRDAALAEAARDLRMCLRPAEGLTATALSQYARISEWALDFLPSDEVRASPESGAAAKETQIKGAANKAFRCIRSIFDLVEPRLQKPLQSAIAALEEFAFLSENLEPEPATELERREYVVTKETKVEGVRYWHRGKSWLKDPDRAHKFASKGLARSKHPNYRAILLTVARRGFKRS